MPPTHAEWRQDRVELTFERQRAHADGAKLITTFVAGLTGTLVATALQVPDDPGSWDKGLEIAAVAGLVLCFLQTVIVIQRDRILLPNPGYHATEAELRSHEFAAEEHNERVVGRVQRAAMLQIVLAAVTGLLAIAALLLP
jgi:hypothetical protein